MDSSELLHRGKAYQNFWKNTKKAYYRIGILSILVFLLLEIISIKTGSKFIGCGLLILLHPLYSTLTNRKIWSCPYCGEYLPVLSTPTCHGTVHAPDESITDCPYCRHNLLYPD